MRPHNRAVFGSNKSTTRVARNKTDNAVAAQRAHAIAETEVAATATAVLHVKALVEVKRVVAAEKDVSVFDTLEIRKR